ncbi:hypothetical protein ACHAW6_006109 [Cyclotella cf. meneghiniana]
MHKNEIMWNWASSKSEGHTEPAEDGSKPSQPPIQVLVIQLGQYDWEAIFSGTKLRDGRNVVAIQVGWEDILVNADTFSSDRRPIVEVRATATSKRQTVRPDFVLVRNEVVTPTCDWRQLLSGLLFADVPSINSLNSIYQFCDRAAMMGYLHRINRRLGNEFPVVKQHFASGFRSFMYGYTFPAVVKVGSAHAGAGKMMIMDHNQMNDFRSVLAMMPNQHCFVEPFIEGSYDIRVQKIGSHIRAFRRLGLSGEWKTNTGTSFMEEVPVEARWETWANEAASMFGGLEILTVDAIVDESTGKEYILEVNGTSSGLHPDCAEDDNSRIRDLVVDRLNTLLCTGVNH